MRPNALLILFVTGLVACSAGNNKPDDTLGTGGPGGGEDGGTGFDPDAANTSGSGLDADPVALDPNKDNDGDGYLFADDCNDRDKLVNPGAFEVLGDGVDNDCDGKIDNFDDCDTSADATHYKTTDANEFAKALGLCRTTTEGATGKAKTWGVISAELVRADGTPISTPVQHAVLNDFGPMKPRAGKNLVALSSGTARTDAYPDFQHPRTNYFKSGNAATPPAGFPKNSSDCQDPVNPKVNDSVNLKLKIRVPTNANSFSYDFDFYSSEYLKYVCTMFNDSFVAILDSKIAGDPKHSKNISFDSKGNPVNVNSGFFEVCTPGSNSGHSFACAKGTSELTGTGFWPDSDDTQDGATSWLETKAPVQPGEEITIQFMIWDTQDDWLDSTVLLDNWAWDAQATTAPVTDRPK